MLRQVHSPCIIPETATLSRLNRGELVHVGAVLAAAMREVESAYIQQREPGINSSVAREIFARETADAAERMATR